MGPADHGQIIFHGASLVRNFVHLMKRRSTQSSHLRKQLETLYGVHTSTEIYLALS